uniref:Dehydrogenase/reductase (SDR family) member 13a, duplicate 3 n=1 Tax=Sphaeramia orbicularis TaxID=375764 RepID=A0A673AT25_9TELE
MCIFILLFKQNVFFTIIIYCKDIVLLSVLLLIIGMDCFPCAGSNTGIGARVILACRNKEKAEAAESGNHQVVFMQLDLASLKSVRNFAESFLKSEPRLDFSSTMQDGLGMAFGRLQRCVPSRIINVAALLHRFGNIDFPLLASKKDLVSGQSTWHNFQAYCSSKLCNVLFTRELANRLEGSAVSCYSLHPGVVYTELCRSLSPWLQILIVPFAKLLFLDPEGGSQTTLHCALQEGIEPLSGRYFSNCALQQVGAKGRDDALAKKLWEVSERLSGL